MKPRLMLMFVLPCIMAGSCARTEVECSPVALSEEPGVASFSWKLSDGRRGVEQTAYELTVFDSSGASLWSSGRVESANTLFVPYEGPELRGGERYGWQVRVWTNTGSRPVVGEGSPWYDGLRPGQWSASWIGLDGSGEVIHDEESLYDLPARYLRREFELSGGIESATLYVSGLGSSDCFINGEPVSEDVFGPLPTWYDASVLYLTYDVTEHVRAGANAIGVSLGNGRYFGTRSSDDYGMNTYRFGYPILLAQLRVKYSDGRDELIVSDESWSASREGPVRRNNEFDGEHYDARMELGEWTLPEYVEDGRWVRAELMPSPKGELRSQTSPSLRVQEELEPVSVRRTSDGRVLLDMGQNMVGMLRVRLHGRAGERITLRFSETLEPSDPERLYVANLRTARVQDVYVPSSESEFEWSPRFVYHGFRYVEISGLDYLPSKSDFRGLVLYDAMRTTGSFTSGNEILNAIHGNAYWGIRGNYRGFPTDCPQRDERQAWLGDRTTGCYGESYIFGNERLYDKWALDIEESMREDGCISDISPRFWTAFTENVTWPAAFYSVVDMLYNHYGNEEAVRRRYPAMRRWVDFIIGKKMVDGTVPYDLYGDWCLPPESPELIHTMDESRKTPGEVLSTTVFYDVLCKMEKLCVVAGHPEHAPYYRNMAASVKDKYNEKFLDREKGCYANNTVTANLLSLNLGLVPEGYEESVISHVVSKTEGEWDGHVSAGVLGVQHLMRGLTDHGHADLAYRIATNDDYPSLGYMYRRGATTIWELWNGDTADPAMNSGNHVMLLGDTVIWMYEDLAGIRASAPGFREIEMYPAFPAGLDNVSASYESPCGRIVSEWRVSGGRLFWDIEIPANCRASVRVPKRFGSVVAGLEPSSEDSEYLFYELGSGRYEVK